MKIFSFSLLHAIKNIYDSWEKVKISVLTGVWKKLTPTLTDDLEGFKTPVGEVTTDVVETARGKELEVVPAAGPELLPSHEKRLLS